MVRRVAMQAAASASAVPFRRRFAPAWSRPLLKGAIGTVAVFIPPLAWMLRFFRTAMPPGASTLPAGVRVLSNIAGPALLAVSAPRLPAAAPVRIARVPRTGPRGRLE